MLLPLITTALCAAPAPSQAEFDAIRALRLDEIDASSSAQFPPEGSKPRKRWRDGQTIMQGFVGVTFYDEYEIDGGDAGSIDGGGDSAAQLPLLGGGAQWKLGGDRIDFGFEGMLSFAWRANATAYAIGGGGAAVAVDVDTMLFDLYGGPFASMFVGEKMRVWAGAGPLLEWAQYEQTIGGESDTGSGFGVGLYARGGFEFAVSSSTMVGLGARWSDSTIDLGGGLGDLDVQGFQAFLTVSQGF